MRQQTRRALRARRRALTPQQQRRHAHALARLLVSHAWFRNSRRIAIYLANDGELDLTPFTQRARRLGKQLFLPVLDRLPSQRLWFAPFEPRRPMRRNRFGIPEPLTHKRVHVPPWGLDLICMPLVAFDRQGNRLGMGGGFYDRSLAYRRGRQSWHKPRLLGIAHALQEVAELEPRPWDIPLSGVATEAEIIPIPPTDRI